MYVKAKDAPTVRDTVKSVVDESKAQKSTKSEVNYRASENADERCDNCEHFIPAKSEDLEGRCKLVRASIDPEYLCDLFEAGDDSKELE